MQLKKDTQKNVGAIYGRCFKREEKEKFKAPNGLMSVNINPQNGKLASKSCPVQYKAYYLTGTQPKTYCTDHIDHAAKTKKKSVKQKVKNFTGSQNGLIKKA